MDHLLDSYSLWAKTTGGTGHSLAAHMIDTASVAGALLDLPSSAGLRSALADSLGLPASVGQRWVTFWAGSHDLGKASPVFQARIGRQGALQAQGWSFPKPLAEAYHGTVTARVLPELLCRGGTWPPVGREFGNRVATAVGGHHGTFPSAAEVSDPRVAASAGSGPWCAARTALLEALAGTVGVTGQLPAPRPPHEPEQVFFMVLAGLTSTADWIASNERCFEYTESVRDWGHYAALSRGRAAKALSELGWSEWRVCGDALDFRRTWTFAPRPLQRAVLEPALCKQGPARAMSSPRTWG